MKYDLPCEMIQDLMPSYIDELTSEKTNEIIEDHLKDCDICTEVMKSMKVPEPEVEVREKQDIDYLKKNRKKTRQRIALASVIAAAAVFALVLYSMYYVGNTVQNAELVEAAVTVKGNQVSVKGNLKDPKKGVLDLVFYREDDSLWLEIKEAARSARNQYEFGAIYIWPEDCLYDINTVYVCGRVAWNQGENISEEVAKVYEARNRYVGDITADLDLASALGVSEGLGEFKNELQTDSQPYGWKIILEDDLVNRENQNAMERKMISYAGSLIALIDNLGYVTFEYSVDGKECTFTLDEESACEWTGVSVKKLAQTPKGLQNLMDMLGLTDNGSVEQLQSYQRNNDGTWICMGRTYQYRIVLTGRDPNAEKDGRYVVLTNDEAITYEEVSRSFYSSNSNDLLDPKEAVVVEIGVN